MIRIPSCKGLGLHCAPKSRIARLTLRRQALPPAYPVVTADPALEAEITIRPMHLFRHPTGGLAVAQNGLEAVRRFQPFDRYRLPESLRLKHHQRFFNDRILENQWVDCGGSHRLRLSLLQFAHQGFDLGDQRISLRFRPLGRYANRLTRVAPVKSPKSRTAQLRTRLTPFPFTCP